MKLTTVMASLLALFAGALAAPTTEELSAGLIRGVGVSSLLLPFSKSTTYLPTPIISLAMPHPSVAPTT